MISNGDKGLNIVREDWEGATISSGEFPSPKHKNLSFLAISFSNEIIFKTEIDQLNREGWDNELVIYYTSPQSFMMTFSYLLA